MKTLVDNVELLRLKNAAEKLNFLEIGGVDNWSYYGDSLESFEEITTIYGGIDIESFHNKQKVFS